MKIFSYKTLQKSKATHKAQIVWDSIKLHFDILLIYYIRNTAEYTAEYTAPPPPPQCSLLVAFRAGICEAVGRLTVSKDTQWQPKKVIASKGCLP